VFTSAYSCPDRSLSFTVLPMAEDLDCSYRTPGRMAVARASQSMQPPGASGSPLYATPHSRRLPWPGVPRSPITSSNVSYGLRE